MPSKYFEVAQSSGIVGHVDASARFCRTGSQLRRRGFAGHAEQQSGAKIYARIMTRLRQQEKAYATLQSALGRTRLRYCPCSRNKWPGKVSPRSQTGNGAIAPRKIASGLPVTACVAPERNGDHSLYLFHARGESLPSQSSPRAKRAGMSLGGCGRFRCPAGAERRTGRARSSLAF